MNKSIRIVLAALLCLASRCVAQVKVTPQTPSGIYKTGETVQWTITSPNPASGYNFNLLRNGITPLKQGPLTFVDGQVILKTSLDEPGAIFLEVRPNVVTTTSSTTPSPATTVPAGRGRGRSGPVPILAGAMMNPEALQPTQPRPADFDAWWSAKIDQLRAIPSNPKLEKADPGRPEVDYYKIQLATIEGHQIHGQLARPAKEDKYPAILILQWAGIYALQKPQVVNRAAQGWLALNIEPHDIEIDRDPAYYQQLTNGDLRDYYHMGNNDREKSYFLRMYLSAWRTAEYLTTRPDWDGRTLVVTGTSMGGQQSFAVAALHERVSAMLVLVPSGCDPTGPTSVTPRAAGFPDWAVQARQKNDPAILDTACYFDPVNFASRIHCPALISMGLFDETSPPVGVYTAFNQIRGPKEALPLHSGHQDQGGSQRPYITRAEQWLAALVKGENVPPK